MFAAMTKLVKVAQLTSAETTALGALSTILSHYGVGDVSPSVVMAMANGDKPIPPLGLKAIKLIQSVMEKPVGSAMALSYLKDLAATNGVDASAITSLLPKAASLIGVPSTGSEVETVSAIINRVLENQSRFEGPTVSGISLCPRCHYVHALTE